MCNEVVFLYKEIIWSIPKPSTGRKVYVGKSEWGWTHSEILYLSTKRGQNLGQSHVYSF